MVVIRGGACLNIHVLKNMDEDERNFWLDLMETAKSESEKAELEGMPDPYVPSDELKSKVQKAIAKYDGDKYCLIQNIKIRFDLNAVFH